MNTSMCVNALTLAAALVDASIGSMIKSGDLANPNDKPVEA